MSVTKRWYRLNVVVRTATIVVASIVSGVNLQIGALVAGPEAEYFKSEAWIRTGFDVFLSFWVGVIFCLLIVVGKDLFAPSFKAMLARRMDVMGTQIFATLMSSPFSDRQRLGLLLDPGSDGKSNRENRLKIIELTFNGNTDFINNFKAWTRGDNSPDAVRAANEIADYLMPDLVLAYIGDTHFRDKCEEFLKDPLIPGMERLSVVLVYNALAEMRKHATGKTPNPEVVQTFQEGLEALKSRLNVIRSISPSPQDLTPQSRMQFSLALKD
jgi:hypothetical protein